MWKNVILHSENKSFLVCLEDILEILASTLLSTQEKTKKVNKKTRNVNREFQLRENSN